MKNYSFKKVDVLGKKNGNFGQYLRRQALFREAGGNEEILQLVLGFPSHSHGGHVKGLAVTKSYF